MLGKQELTICEAIFNNDVELVKAFIGVKAKIVPSIRFILHGLKRVDINSKDDVGHTALENAVHYEKPVMVSLLLDHGAEISALAIVLARQSKVNLIADLINHALAKREAQQLASCVQQEATPRPRRRM